MDQRLKRLEEEVVQTKSTQGEMDQQMEDYEERRKELAKLAGQYAEKARVAIRNVRRDGMDSLKTDEKKGEISEDERKRFETEVQKLTDDMIAQADAAATQKEKEILGQ